MPVLGYAIAGLVLFGGGFVAGDGVDGISRGVKWTVLGGVGYLAWRNRAVLGRAFR